MIDALRIKLVVFDWAGTTVDHGCFAPVAPFVDAFALHGVTITAAEARGPMGLGKRDHIRALTQMPAIAQRWRDAHGTVPSEDDVGAIFDAFVPLQLESVLAHSMLIDGVLDVVAELRGRDIHIGTTTGYFAEAAQRCYASAAAQGYAPDVNLCPSDVSEGRPAPWMIFKIMEQLGVYPPSSVLKIGDTIPDIEEGLSAGVWSAGVTATGSDVGLTAEELAALATEERTRRLDAVSAILFDAGAHYVVESVREVPALIDEIDARLGKGEAPSRGRVAV